MKPRELLDILSVAERLKDAVRHCYTSGGRRESVAEHSWMMTVMAFFMRDEFPDADMDKVIEMCIIHDLGEAFTGDIPTFEKTKEDEKREEELLADWIKPDADMDKVIEMCIIHDLGEAFTGDIPTFEKTKEDEKREEELLADWIKTLPSGYAEKMQLLYEEIEEQNTQEAKIYKAIDKLEALIQHNMSDLSTWLPLEYDLQKTHGNDKVGFSEYMKELRAEILKDTLKKTGEY